MFLLPLIAAAAAAATAAPPPLAPLAPPFSFDRKGTAAVQFMLPGGGDPDVGLTYFIADGIAARIDFGLDAVLAPSGTPATFNLGVGLRFYQLKHGPVALFLQPSIVFGREKIATGLPTDAAEYLTFAGGVGVEYFFTDHLSAGGLLSLGLSLHDLGAPAGTQVITELSTATSGLFASFYF